MPEAAPAIQGPSARPEVNPSLMANVQMTPEAAGGGRPAEQEAQLGNQIASHLASTTQLEIIRANNASTIERATAAKAYADKILYGDETEQNPGFLKQPWSVMKDQYPQVMKSLQDGFSKITESSPNPLSKQMLQEKLGDFNDTVQARIQQAIDKAHSDHEVSVQKDANAQMMQATMHLGSSPADIATFGHMRADFVDTTLKFGALRFGLGDDGKSPSAETQNLVRDGLAQIDEARVDGLLQNHDPRAAYTYLKQESVQKELAHIPKKFDELNNAVLTDLMKQDVTTTGAGLISQIAKANPDATLEVQKQMALGKAIDMTYKPDYNKSKEYTDGVRANIKEYYDSQIGTQKAQQEQMTNNIFDRAWTTGEMPPQSTLDKLGIDERTLTAGPPKHSDPRVVDALKYLASMNPKDFMDEQLASNYRGRLTPTDYNKFFNEQQKMQKDANWSEDKSAFKDYKVQNEIANEALESMNIVPNATQPTTSGKPSEAQQFRTDLDQDVEEWKRENPGKPLERAKVYEIASRLVVSHVKEAAAAADNFGQLSTISDPADIPSDMDAPIKTILDAWGIKKPTPEQRMRAYNFGVSQSQQSIYAR